MIKYVHYDELLDSDSGCIIHGVNCQGKMNSGIAKDIRERFPAVYDDYMRHLAKCESQQVDPLGTVVYTKISPDLVIASAFIQQYYGRNINVTYCSYPAIYQCFKIIARDVLIAARHYANPKLAVLRFPKIGCGLANGTWSSVDKEIRSATVGLIDDHNLHLYIKHRQASVVSAE